MVDQTDQLVVKSHVARDLLQNAALFKTDKLALWEYVVNGLQYVDPGTNPIVKVRLDSKAKSATITDNGRGMDWPGLQNFFVMHGENIDLKSGKPGRGRFGTGKSAAFGIGETFTITTVHQGKRSKVRLSYLAVKAMSSADSIPVETIEKEIATSEPNGTTVEIGGIHLKSLDQPGIIAYVERHLAKWPKGATVFVNNHECEFREPAVSEEREFLPEGVTQQKLGAVRLVIKVSKTHLEEDLRGIAIFANGVWHETTLAGSEGREMSQYIFGDIDVPRLDEDESPSPPFDLSRSMRLNSENELVQTIYAFIGQKVDLVRRELVEKEKKRKESEDAKKLAEQASQIAKIINDDFNDFRQKLAKARAKVTGGTDLHDTQEGGVGDDDFILGGTEPAEEVSESGGPGHGNGSGDGEDPPEAGPQVKPSPTGEKKARPVGGSDGDRKPRGGFDVKFREMGEESARADYVREERTIYINLDHPQLVAARGLASTDEAAFRRLSYEVAFSEYAIALAHELNERGDFIEPSDAIVEIGITLNRIARKGAALYK